MFVLKAAMRIEVSAREIARAEADTAGASLPLGEGANNEDNVSTAVMRVVFPQAAVTPEIVVPEVVVEEEVDEVW